MTIYLVDRKLLGQAYARTFYFTSVEARNKFILDSFNTVGTRYCTINNVQEVEAQ